MRQRATKIRRLSLLVRSELVHPWQDQPYEGIIEGHLLIRACTVIAGTYLDIGDAYPRKKGTPPRYCIQPGCEQFSKVLQSVTPPFVLIPLVRPPDKASG